MEIIFVSEDKLFFNTKAQNCQDLVQFMLWILKDPGCNMSVKFHHLNSHRDHFPENFGQEIHSYSLLFFVEFLWCYLVLDIENEPFYFVVKLFFYFKQDVYVHFIAKDLSISFPDDQSVRWVGLFYFLIIFLLC